MLAKSLTRRLLQGPPKSTPPLHDAEWPSQVREGPRAPYRFHVNRRQASAPTVIAVHGWTSGVAHARNRTQALTEAGFHVILLESLGHGSSTYDGPWTAHCVLECLEDLLDGLFSGALGMSPTRLLLHGHSLGAYVILRLLHGRHGDRVEALLLESPMTRYSPIFEEILLDLGWPRWLPGFRARLIRRMMKEWKAMHPNVSITDLADVDVPRWGKPKVPTFVMQADPDHRLGPVHLDALRSCMPHDLLDVWRSTTLRHSGTSIHHERDAAMMAWLEAKAFIPHC
ncbi:MAG: alpha/beta fold hydrolase [Candidatus Thermoplasmatota archaeon]|nr:alpha/beta fold hydrolase [Candidatus Thermoplasmatota archaeon]MEC7150836.1 alpha/beta fold hydrolase [Candidatus Thermoplasmatota archaeon]MEC8078856.1 alpha/beta fold hydrolase [Candidatus Thermoplasmatota archaeon]MEC9204769.1 alpha/beta fold hydrolase [Candidatus Thermoplasmatota archaeon]MEE2666985.1 alpha/beta fold hydrolase [Candidatus Thermoplasmatota archaeon]